MVPCFPCFICSNEIFPFVLNSQHPTLKGKNQGENVKNALLYSFSTKIFENCRHASVARIFLNTKKSTSHFFISSKYSNVPFYTNVTNVQNCSSLMSYLICGPAQIPYFTFSLFSLKKILVIYKKQAPCLLMLSISDALTYRFMTPK